MNGTPSSTCACCMTSWYLSNSSPFLGTMGANQKCPWLVEGCPVARTPMPKRDRLGMPRLTRSGLPGRSLSVAITSSLSGNSSTCSSPNQQPGISLVNKSFVYSTAAAEIRLGRCHFSSSAHAPIRFSVQYCCSGAMSGRLLPTTCRSWRCSGVGGGTSNNMKPPPNMGAPMVVMPLTMPAFCR